MLKGIKKSKPSQMKQNEEKMEDQNTIVSSLKAKNHEILELFLNGKQQQLKSSMKELENMESQYFNGLVSHQNEQDLMKKDQKSKFSYQLDFQDEEDIKTKRKKKPRMKPQKTQQYCILCPQNQELLLISASNYVYLALPKVKTFKRYPHFILSPVEHQQTMVGLDEDILQEIKNYQKCLIQMYDQMNLHVVFLEQFSVPNSHIYIQCLAVPPSKVYDMPFFFKQGLEEVQGNWTTHKNIIEIKKEKGGLQKQIPKKIKYFYIDFGIGYGYAHVIENEKFWKRDFCYQIIATALGIQRYEIKTTEQYPEDELETKMKDFEKKWINYDWTKLIDA